mgnify:CR=1 FL=1
MVTYQIEVYRGQDRIISHIERDKDKAMALFKKMCYEHSGLYENYEVYLIRFYPDGYDVLYSTFCERVVKE